MSTVSKVFAWIGIAALVFVLGAGLWWLWGLRSL